MENVKITLYDTIYFEYEEIIKIKTERLKKLYLLNIPVERMDDDIVNTIIEMEYIKGIERIWLLNKELVENNIYIDELAKNGKIKIIEWIWGKSKKKEIEFEYTYAINTAAENGHLDVIEWFWEKYKKEGLEFKYREFNVLETENMAILEWVWEKRTNEELEFIIDGVIDISYTGNVQVLEWIYNKYKENNLEFKYDEENITCAVHGGHLNIIEWYWEKSITDELEFKYNKEEVKMELTIRPSFEDWFLNKNLI